MTTKFKTTQKTVPSSGRPLWPSCWSSKMSFAVYLPAGSKWFKNNWILSLRNMQMYSLLLHCRYNLNIFQVVGTQEDVRYPHILVENQGDSHEKEVQISEQRCGVPFFQWRTGSWEHLRNLHSFFMPILYITLKILLDL